ncbi:MAG: hypothetical protein RLZ16_201, partial [Bacteroidota bacterium]
GINDLENILEKIIEKFLSPPIKSGGFLLRIELIILLALV